MKYKSRLLMIVLVVLIVCGAVIYFAVIISRGFEEIAVSNNNILPPTFAISKEDSDLIDKKYVSKLQSCTNFNEVGRNPLSGIDFDKNYVLLIHKIDIAKEGTLADHWGLVLSRQLF